MSVTQLACELCQLPVTGGAFETHLAGQTQRFCCAGCLNVYSILAESGALDQKERAAAYQASLRLGLLGPRSPDSSSGGDPAAVRDPTGDGLSAESLSALDGLERDIEVPVGGMWCASCSWLIDRVLSQRRGVISCQASFVNDSARIRYNPRFISRQEILDQIRELGYDPQTTSGRPADDARRDLLLRFGVACAPAMYMMMFDVFLYEGYFHTLDPSIVHFLHQLLFWLSLPILTWCAWPIYRKAWGALRQGSATMETLITLGAGSAFLYSVYATFRGLDQVYYDTASMLVTLVLLGKYLEAIARSRATAAVGLLGSALPKKVRLRLPNGEERMVAADQVQVGDLLVVDSGAVVPVDGIVVDGVAALDEALLTGEAAPVRRLAGDTVSGGSLCVEGGIVVEAQRTGSGTTVARIVQIVREALSSRSSSERLADAVSRIFVPVIVLIAALVLGRDLFLQHRAMEASVMQAVSVLVVACPCALGMATPLAIAAAMGSAANRGILVRNADTLEKARRIDTVVLDKTGTVTRGQLEVLERIVPEGHPTDSSFILHPSSFGQPDPWDAVMSLEALSQHPAARAMVGWLQERGHRILPDVQIEIVPGKGIRGSVGGLPVLVGAREISPAVPESLSKRLDAAEREGNTVVVASSGDRVLGAFVLSDRPRRGSAEAVSRLQQLGLEVWLVSGDSETTTNAVASQVGIRNVVSRALPEDKIARIRELQAAGHCVAMVGDGINDGPALAAADMGVAMGEGTQLALEAADLALLSGDLRRLPYALHLSSRVVRVIRQNLFWALFYNLLSVPAAAGFYGPRLTIGPLFAAVAMLISSLSVVCNSLRLLERAPS